MVLDFASSSIMALRLAADPLVHLVDRLWCQCNTHQFHLIGFHEPIVDPERRQGYWGDCRPIALHLLDVSKDLTHRLTAASGNNGSSSGSRYRQPAKQRHSLPPSAMNCVFAIGQCGESQPYKARTIVSTSSDYVWQPTLTNSCKFDICNSANSCYRTERCRPSRWAMRPICSGGTAACQEAHHNQT